MGDQRVSRIGPGPAGGHDDCNPRLNPEVQHSLSHGVQDPHGGSAGGRDSDEVDPTRDRLSVGPESVPHFGGDAGFCTTRGQNAGFITPRLHVGGHSPSARQAACEGTPMGQEGSSPIERFIVQPRACTRFDGNARGDENGLHFTSRLHGSTFSSRACYVQGVGEYVEKRTGESVIE